MESVVIEERESLLLVGARAPAVAGTARHASDADWARSSDPDWAGALRGRYALWDTRYAGSYLSAIVEASRRRPRAVLAAVDETVSQPAEAVAGLRIAVGKDARLVLCCGPEVEPGARRAVSGGADEYVLLPLREKDVDAAIGYPRPTKGEFVRLTNPTTASMEELEHVAGLFEAVEQRPMAMLERLAALVRIALSSRGATVIVEGAIATSGDVVTKPVLMAAVSGSRGVVGQLTVSERSSGAYTPGDAEKLQRYAGMASRALSLGSVHRRMRQLSVTDEATGLPNRRHLYEKLEAILRQAQRDRFPVTVLLFDIDDFKSLHDRLGYDAGDRVLRALGALFRKHCREQDVVARYGGDEFAVVFWDATGPRKPGSQPPECAMSVLDRVRAALSSPGGIEDVRLTISGGLATYPWDATTREELIARADSALLEAKRAGKNCVVPIRTERG